VRSKVFFRDVDKGAWYINYICKARDEQLVGGYPDGTFRPGNYINFVEAAKIIASASATITSNPRLPSPNPNSPWYERYIRFLEARNVIPKSIMTLDQEISRGEMAEMIYRLDAKVTGMPSVTYSQLTGIPEEEETSQVEPSGTDGVQIYKNTKDGYQIDHLDSWKIEENTTMDDRLNSISGGEVVGTKFKAPDGVQAFIFTAVTQTCPDLSHNFEPTANPSPSRTVKLSGRDFKCADSNDGAAGSVGENTYCASRVGSNKCLVIGTSYFHTTGDALDEPQRTTVKRDISMMKVLIETIVYSFREI
jgi:hypothetical protein|tara:strand:+ start:485 stop:1402 length:918 start_codon:yes stop_codon:yes gene_type:complete